MHASSVIGMRVGGHRNEVTAKKIGRRCAQARHTKSRVNQQIGVSRANVPDVATKERMDMRLPKESHVPDASALKPASRRRRQGHVTTVQRPFACTRSP